MKRHFFFRPRIIIVGLTREDEPKNSSSKHIKTKEGVLQLINEWSEQNLHGPNVMNFLLDIQTRAVSYISNHSEDVAVIQILRTPEETDLEKLAIFLAQKMGRRWVHVIQKEEMLEIRTPRVEE